MDDITRYAHCDGYTDISFDESGTNFVTGGADGDIRVWNGFEDDDPQSHNMGKTVTAVALKNKFLYVANDSFNVSAYTFPEIEFESIVAQYNSGVYCIACNKEGNLVASGGGDFIIKVYNTSDKSLKAFRGHDGPVLSLAFDPDGRYLASSGCDGTFRVWNISDQECIKTLNIFKKSNDKSLSSPQYHLSWSPDGKLVAAPVEKEIHLYLRDLWECQYILKDDSIVQSTSVVAFSPFGNYIAASAVDGHLVVWDAEKKSCVSRKSHEKKIALCKFAWNPSGKDILFCDIEGQLGIYEKPLASSQVKVPKAPSKDVPIDFECEDDEDKNFDDDDANDLDLIHDNDDAEADADDLALVSDDGGDNAFDIGAIKAELEPKIFGDDDDDVLETASTKSIKEEPKIQIIEAPKPLIQAPFQPTSAPIHLERRFMLWNAVGIVRCYNTEEENTIDVEFHDANVYHPLHLNNTRNHTLAALSTEALLMACPKADEITSKLECLHFGTWDSNKEWIVEMPEDEEIESICVGDGFAACVTDKRFLRVFTISGVQVEVISVPGSVVCSAAKDKQILVAYHRGLGIENDQSLNLMIIDLKLGGHCRIRDYGLPLSSKSFLSWLGYTDEGHPCIVDSSGIVNILNLNFGVKWIPVCNTKSNLKGKSDTYFVLGLSEIKQEVRCIFCKGAKYPGLLPRPTVVVVPFTLPFCEMTADKGRLEEENRRYSMTHKRLEALMKEGYDLDSEYNTIDKKWMDVLLKMFALATRTDREYRALDIAELMPTPIIVQGAIRYATQRHRMALAERLGEVMNKKILENDDGMDTDPIEEYHSFNISRNSSYSKSMRLVNGEDNETVLKPKPLVRIKSETPKISENSESILSDSTLAAEDSENTSTPKSSAISNPFKAKLKATKKDDSSSAGIDSLLDTSMKNLNNKSNTSTPVSKLPTKKPKSQEQKNEIQTKLNNFQPETQPKKYGFQLFLEQNRDSILCSSESEMSETEIVRTAMKMYKELPEAEKQKYTEKKGKENVPKDLNAIQVDKEEETPPESIENSSSLLGSPSSSTSASSSKRKETSDVESDIPKPKKLKNNASKLSDTTVKKLTQFAFTKSKANK